MKMMNWEKYIEKLKKLEGSEELVEEIRHDLLVENAKASARKGLKAQLNTILSFNKKCQKNGNEVVERIHDYGEYWILTNRYVLFAMKKSAFNLEPFFKAQEPIRGEYTGTFNRLFESANHMSKTVFREIDYSQVKTAKTLKEDFIFVAQNNGIKVGFNPEYLDYIFKIMGTGQKLELKQDENNILSMAYFENENGKGLICPMAGGV